MDQYGCANSGRVDLSLGQPVRTREWRVIWSGSEEAAALMSRMVASWKPESSGVVDSNSTR